MNIRSTFYLMTIASCGVLASIFVSRGQTWWAVGIAVVALVYVARWIIAQRRERTERIAEFSRPQNSAEKQAIVENLLATRDHLARARIRELLGGLMIIIFIVYIYPTNLALAFASSVFLLPLGYLLIRHTRAITQIERGLSERGLLPANKR